jgi:hypothetical protein
MVSLQYGFGVAASQTFVAITLEMLSELLGGKASTTGVPRPDGAGLPWLSHTERTALSVLDDSLVHAH